MGSSKNTSEEDLKKQFIVGEEINNYRKNQKGDQPVRVLNNLTLFKLLHENSYINKLFKIGVIKHGVYPEVSIIYGNVSLRKEDGKTYNTPNMTSKKHLQIHETFLSIIWIISYSLLALTSERYFHPCLSEEWLKKSNERQNLAKELYNYAKLLVVDFVEWNKNDLPNPEKYIVEEADYIGQAKMYYIEAIKFILYHEFVHSVMHIEKDVNERERIELELEADKISLDLVLNVKDDTADFISECGAIIGVLTNFIVSHKTKKIDHPNLEDRLKYVLQQCKSEYRDFAFCFACIGIELWAEQFSIVLAKKESEKDFEKKFDDYYKQLSEMV